MPPFSQSIDLVGLGLNATDTVLSLPHYPASGSKLSIAAPALLPGGQVATVVAACATWGLATRYIGKLGDDHHAALHRREFARLAVDARIVVAPGAPSPQSYILVDPSGERTVLNQRDPRLTLQPEEIAREWVLPARALHLDGYDTQAAVRAARWAREAGTPVVADLDEQYPGIEELLPLIDHLIVSRDFAQRLTGEPSLALALQQMHARCGCVLSAATLGENGVLAWDGTRFYAVPAFQVSVVDTTGAGDLFHAGYIYGLLGGWPLEQRLRFACAAAALNCTAPGARGYIAPLAAIERLLAEGMPYGGRQEEMRLLANREKV